MSAAEYSRDDSEPPSRPLSQYSVSISIDDALDSSTVPPSEQINAWVEHVIPSVPANEQKAIHFDVSVSVVDENAMQTLNREYRSKDKPTNVLSFPSGMPLMAAEPGNLSFQALGDIVICQPVMVSEAIEQNKPIEHHFAHMLVHSVLHLFGYDHETQAEAETMEALEIKMLSELSIPNPYQLSFQKQ